MPARKPGHLDSVAALEHVLSDVPAPAKALGDGAAIFVAIFDLALDAATKNLTLEVARGPPSALVAQFRCIDPPDTDLAPVTSYIETVTINHVADPTAQHFGGPDKPVEFLGSPEAG